MSWFKSKTQPLCRCCGKAIKKRTVAFIVDKHPPGPNVHHTNSEFWRHVYSDPLPKTKADCQRLTNLEVVSLRKHNGDVVHFGAWDGESYDDEFFCTGGCAQRWGYVMAELYPNRVSKSYNEALALREAKHPKEDEVEAP